VTRAPQCPSSFECQKRCRGMPSAVGCRGLRRLSINITRGRREHGAARSASRAARADMVGNYHHSPEPSGFENSPQCARRFSRLRAATQSAFPATSSWRDKAKSLDNIKPNRSAAQAASECHLQHHAPVMMTVRGSCCSTPAMIRSVVDFALPRGQQARHLPRTDRQRHTG